MFPGRLTPSEGSIPSVIATLFFILIVFCVFPGGADNIGDCILSFPQRYSCIQLFSYSVKSGPGSFEYNDSDFFEQVNTTMQDLHA